MFGCASQTQFVFVGQQANLNAGHDKYQIKKAQLQSPKVRRGRGSMRIVNATQLFFASWKVLQSFSFPIQLLVFKSWSVIGVQAHHRWIFGEQVCVNCCFCMSGSVELKS